MCPNILKGGHAHVRYVGLLSGFVGKPIPVRTANSNARWDGERSIHLILTHRIRNILFRVMYGGWLGFMYGWLPFLSLYLTYLHTNIISSLRMCR